MDTVATDASTGNNRFRNVAQAFLEQEGLPFAQVLDAETIRQAFVDHDGLFAPNDIYSTEIVLWAFLAQVLRDGKGAACAEAYPAARA